MRSESAADPHDSGDSLDLDWVTYGRAYMYQLAACLWLRVERIYLCRGILRKRFPAVIARTSRTP